MPSLILIMEGYDRQIYPLGKATLFVGRQDDADIQLPCDSVSHNHASVVFDNNQFVMRDNGSVNGSFVNGIKVSRCILKHFDIVRFGSYVFLVNMYDGITEQSGFPQRQEFQIDTQAPVQSSGIASKGLSIRLTEPVRSPQQPDRHVPMLVGHL